MRNPIPEEHRDEIIGELRETEPLCNEICVTAEDLGVLECGSMIAYPHPECPVHGEVS